MSAQIEGFRLEWLTSFLAVVDHGGFAVAAEASYRSQSRISTHVAELERALGATLFDRKERPVRLTEAGVAYLEHARRVVRTLEAGAASVQAVLGLLRGRVMLGVTPGIGAAFAPALLHAFDAQHPAVDVVLVEGTEHRLQQDLIDGDTDVVVAPVTASADPAIRHHPLWEEPLVAVVPTHHPAAALDYVSLADIADAQLITIGSDRDDEGTSEVEVALVAAGAGAVRRFRRTQEPQTLVALAAAGLGVGIANLLAVEVADTSEVAVVPLRDAGVRVRSGVHWNAARPMQPAARALVDLISQVPAPQSVQRFQRRR